MLRAEAHAPALCSYLPISQCGDGAGRAAEELTYGLDEMTSINQGKLVLARRIVQKLVASAALNDELGPRTLAYDSGIKGRRKYLLVPETVSPVGPAGLHVACQEQMAAHMHCGYVRPVTGPFHSWNWLHSPGSLQVVDHTHELE